MVDYRTYHHGRLTGVSVVRDEAQPDGIIIECAFYHPSRPIMIFYFLLRNRKSAINDNDRMPENSRMPVIPSSSGTSVVSSL